MFVPGFRDKITFLMERLLRKVCQTSPVHQGKFFVRYFFGRVAPLHALILFVWRQTNFATFLKVVGLKIELEF